MTDGALSSDTEVGSMRGVYTGGQGTTKAIRAPKKSFAAEMSKNKYKFYQR